MYACSCWSVVHVVEQESVAFGPLLRLEHLADAHVPLCSWMYALHLNISQKM